MMTGDQVKAYLNLLCESWLELPRATLPNDVVQLSLMSRMSKEDFMSNWDGIMSNFKLDLKLNRFYNEKLLEVSEKQILYAENGKLGGRPKILKMNQK